MYWDWREWMGITRLEGIFKGELIPEEEEPVELPPGWFERVLEKED